MRYQYNIKAFAYQLLFAGLERGEVIALTLLKLKGYSVQSKEICELIDEVISEMAKQEGYYDPKVATSLSKPQSWSPSVTIPRTISIPKKR